MITANDELIDDDTALVPPVPVIWTFVESFTGVLPFSTNAGTEPNPFPNMFITVANEELTDDDSAFPPYPS